MYMNWKKVDSSTPKDVVLNTKIDDANGIRNVQKLVLRGKLWRHSDGSMYTYYTPTHWSF